MATRLAQSLPKKWLKCRHVPQDDGVVCRPSSDDLARRVHSYRRHCVRVSDQRATLGKRKSEKSIITNASASANSV